MTNKVKLLLLIASILSIIIISIVLSLFSSLHFLRTSNIYEYGYYTSKTENNNKDYNVTPVLKNNSIEYKFSRNNVTVSGPYNNAHTNEFRESTIALVKPTFTDAAYNNKFYNFYSKYSNVTSKVNVTRDLNLLNSKITNYQRGTVNNVFAMLELVKVMKWIDSRTKIDIISD